MVFNHDQIRDWINLYWEGETSLEQEDAIRQYFQQDNIVDDLKPFQSLFGYYSNQRQTGLSHNFDQKLLEKIDTPAKPSLAFFSNTWLRVAAAIVLLTGFFIVMNVKPSSEIAKRNDIEITDPELAYETIEMALSLVSKKLNDGAQKTQKEVYRIHEATEILR